MTDTRLTYFRGRGRAETTRWMLAATGESFSNEAIDTPEELALLRASGKLPYDQMPLLEIDGLHLSQSSAMVRFLARRNGMYGTNDTEAMWCDMVAGVVGDFAETALQAAFQPTAELAIAGLNARFEKFGSRFETHIAQQGAGFCAGDRMTFADVVLSEALSSYLEWIPDLLDDMPLLKALYSQVTTKPGIARYLASDLRYPKPDDDYVIRVARVLRRALPPHFPSPDRFVVDG